MTISRIGQSGIKPSQINIASPPPIYQKRIPTDAYGLNHQSLASRTIVSVSSQQVIKLSKITSLLQSIVSWVLNRPSPQHIETIVPFLQQAANTQLSDTEIQKLFRKGRLQLPRNSSEAYAMMLLVDQGLAKLENSPENCLTIQLKRPKNWQELENKLHDAFVNYQADSALQKAQTQVKQQFSPELSNGEPELSNSEIEQIAHASKISSAEDMLLTFLQQPVNFKNIYSAVAQYNIWFSLACRLQRQTIQQPGEEVDALDTLLTNEEQLLSQLKELPIDPLLKKAAPEILMAPLADEANHMTKRVKASAPLVLLWLLEQLEIEPSTEPCTTDEKAAIAAALNKIDPIDIG